MALTDQQRQRIAFGASDLRRAPEFAIFRQFCTAECAQDNPDFFLLKHEIMSALDKAIDAEIAGAKKKYEALAQRP